MITDNNLKVVDRPDLVRDPHTKAVLSIDANKLQEHRSKKAFFEGINKTSKEVEDLKCEIKELKSTLNLILEKLITK